MNLCINCRHINREFDSGTGEGAVCQKLYLKLEKQAPVNPVTGESEVMMQFTSCHLSRALACGPDGDWYEETTP